MRILILSIILLAVSAVSVQAYDRVIDEVWTEAAEKSADKRSFDAMLEASLSGLKKYDRTLIFGNDGNRISIYRNGRMLESIAKPEDQDPKKWAALNGKMADFAIKNSDNISLFDFEAADEMMAAMVRYFNDDSKYYKSMDLADNLQYKAKSNFGVSREGDFLYVQMLLFDQDSKKNMKKAFKENTDAQGMILDLRGNSGGSLSAMTGIANMLIDGGIIISTKGNSEDANKFYNAEEGDEFGGKPIVIIVDAETASSAEALTASLQEQGRAKVVGTRTYGKGSIQDLIKLNNGSELLLTTAYIVTPGGKELRDEGVMPDVCLALMDARHKPEVLVNQVQNGVCPKEKRRGKPLDVKVAAQLLKKEIH